MSNDKRTRTLASVMQKAGDDVLPDLFKLLQRKTGSDPLVALSALATAIDVIIDHEISCIRSGDDAAVAKFEEDAAKVMELSGKHWKARH